MSLINNYYEKIPEYYKTMYMDGYSPEQILHAARQKMIREHEAKAEANEIPDVKIISEVKIK